MLASTLPSVRMVGVANQKGPWALFKNDNEIF